MVGTSHMALPGTHIAIYDLGLKKDQLKEVHVWCHVKVLRLSNAVPLKVQLRPLIWAVSFSSFYISWGCTQCRQNGEVTKWEVYAHKGTLNFFFS